LLVKGLKLILGMIGLCGVGRFTGWKGLLLFLAGTTGAIWCCPLGEMLKLPSYPLFNLGWLYNKK
jgi:hypothetical protein